MPLIKTKNYFVPSIPEMHRLALKRIFEKQNMTITEEQFLDEGVGHWCKKVDLKPEVKKELSTIVGALLANEDGAFGHIKQLVKDHKLDYRKLYEFGVGDVQ